VLFSCGACAVYVAAVTKNDMDEQSKENNYEIEVANEGEYNERKSFKTVAVLEGRQYLKLCKIILDFVDNPTEL
jgi:hypothetical protein